MAKGSDSPFPSVLVVLGTTPTAPAAGQVRLFVDVADGHIKTVNSASVVTDLGPASVPSKAALVAGKLQAHATLE